MNGSCYGTQTHFAEQARDLIESGEGYVYLDVRSVPEFEAGHAPGAKNIPLLHRTPMGMQPNDRFVEVCDRALDKDAKIITACLVGGRSLRAAQILIANGFANVVDMRGGFQGESDRMGRLVYPGWMPARSAGYNRGRSGRDLRGTSKSLMTSPPWSGSYH